MVKDQFNYIITKLQIKILIQEKFILFLLKFIIIMNNNIYIVLNFIIGKDMKFKKIL